MLAFGGVVFSHFKLARLIPTLPIKNSISIQHHANSANQTSKNDNQIFPERMGFFEFHELKSDQPKFSECNCNYGDYDHF